VTLNTFAAWPWSQRQFHCSSFFSSKRCVDAGRPSSRRTCALSSPGVTFANSLADCEDDVKLSELDDASANLQEEIDQLEEALEVPDPEQQALSGAIVTIGRDGKVEIERGRLKPQDVKRFRRASSNSEQQERAAPRTHPASMTRRPTAHRTLANSWRRRC
jgi:hypothetical protein